MRFERAIALGRWAQRNCAQFAHGSKLNARSLAFPHGLVEQFAGNFGGGSRHFRNDPLHFACLDFILCDPARLARMGIDNGRRSTLELAGTPRRDQDVPIVAVETINQLHLILPCITARWQPYLRRTVRLAESVRESVRGGTNQPAHSNWRPPARCAGAAPTTE